MAEILRVLRLLEYVGERALVERTLEKSIKGTLVVQQGADRPPLVIRSATLGDFPEVMTDDEIRTAEGWIQERMQRVLEKL